MFAGRRVLTPLLKQVNGRSTYSSLAELIPARSSNVRARTQPSVKPVHPLRQQAQPQQQQPAEQVKAAPNGRSRRDEEISARFITFVDDQGQVHSRSRTRDVLNSFDRARFFLIEVDPNAKPNPVCRLFDKKMLFEKEKQNKKKKTTAPESILKEIVFGWNVSAHDMEHKLNKAVQFLDKGNKVKIDIVYKRGQKRVDKEGQQEVITSVSQILNDYKLSKKPAFAGQNCSMQYEKK